MKVLVCGGAGYIGSHMVRRLLRDGVQTVVFDNLSTGHRESVGETVLIQGDLLAPSQLRDVFARHRFDAVMHFCARSLVGESMHQPYGYYENNVVGTLNLLQAMREADVRKLVFSSTAAVFGHPQSEFIDESHPTRPINPYGASKRMVEIILEDAARAHGLRSVALRYFNAAGASPEGDIGESHSPETHLIPNMLRAANGDAPALKVFGNGYATPDGTCVRDYVHVDDLADAHSRALDFMASNEGAHAFNLGNGAGFSVLQMIHAASEVARRPIPYEIAPPRSGDPDRLVAASARARHDLGWTPRYTDIEQIIETAWRWHRNPRY